MFLTADETEYKVIWLISTVTKRRKTTLLSEKSTVNTIYFAILLSLFHIICPNSSILVSKPVSSFSIRGLGGLATSLQGPWTSAQDCTTEQWGSPVNHRRWKKADTDKRKDRNKTGSWWQVGARPVLFSTASDWMHAMRWPQTGTQLLILGQLLVWAGSPQTQCTPRFFPYK